MLHILLEILKIIGIIILVLLATILIIAAGILFVPIRYKAHIKKNDELQISARVWWFCHIIEGIYDYPQNSIVIKIFGLEQEKYRNFWRKIKSFFSKFKKKKKLKENKNPVSNTEKEFFEKKEQSFKETGEKVKSNKIKEENNKAAIEKKEVIENKDSKEEKSFSKSTYEKDVGEEKTEKENPNNGFLKNICAIISKGYQFLKSLPGRFKNLWYTFKEKRDEFDEKAGKIKSFIEDDGNRAAFSFLKKELMGLIKYINPKKVKGWLNFGFDDPSVTGKTLGILGMLMPIYKDNLRIIPDFEKAIFEGEVKFTGRIRLYRILILVIKTLKNENVMKLYREISK